MLPGLDHLINHSTMSPRLLINPSRSPSLVRYPRCRLPLPLGPLLMPWVSHRTSKPSLVSMASLE